MSKMDEAVEAACRVVAVRAGEDWETMHEFMKGVIRKTQEEALRAALPVLLGEPRAYQLVKKTDDPDVLNVELWATAPGMKLPDGAIALYTADLEVG